MPRGKQQKDADRAKSKKPNSFLSSLKRILFSCTGRKSVRVLPQQISVRPPTAWDNGTRPSRDRHSAHTSAALFCSSSRPTTAAKENGSRLSPYSPIDVSSTVAVKPVMCAVPTGTACDMNATSGHTISVRPEFAGHHGGMPGSNLIGLNPSPTTSTTNNSGLVPRRPGTATISDSNTSRGIEERKIFFRTTLTQIRKQQRQKRREEKMKREEERIKREEELFGKMERVKPPNKLILEEELKPKKKLSEQICEEEKAIKEMEQLLVDLDGDETEVFKKMQQLNNWRVEIETIKDVNQYAIKSAKLNDVILILEDQLHLLKNGSARTAAQLADKTEKLTKMRADYELIMASGISEEDVETNELLKQFLPTLGLPPDTIVGVDLELEDIDDDHSTSSSPCNSAPPRCRNPVATQLLRETESRKQKPAVTAASAMPDILHEYRDTLKRDSKMVKKNKAGVRSNDDGLRRFMQSQIKKGTSK